MAPRKSLAAELADLVTSVPTAEVDVLDELEQRPELVESDEELFADLQEAPRRGKEKGLRLRAGIDLDQEDVRYVGRRTTRAAAFKDDLAGADEEDDEDEEDDGSDDDSREWQGAGMAGSEEGASVERYESGDVDGSDGGHGDMTELGSASSLQDEEEEEEEEGLERWRGDEDEMAAEAAAAAPSSAGRGGEMEALERDFAELRAAEAAAQKEVQDRRERDLAKGMAVQNQQGIWAKVLGMRILLQKALLASHSLPGPEWHSRAVQRSDLARGFSDLKRAASSVLDALLDLGSALVQQNPAVEAAATTAAAAAEREAEPEPALGKRDRSSFDSDSSFLWHRLEQANEQWTDFRDAAVDRWHRKASLQSGAAVLQGKGLRALNQGISVQVRDLMSQPERAMRKSQLLLSDRPRQLCNGLRDSEGDGAPASSPEAVPEQYDPETFDDADFYQLLLKQFLEGGSDAAPDTMAVLRASKKKKSVDRRASKGRKIRYQVHEKLANFMVPVEQEVPLFAERLFSNFASTGDLEVAV